MQKPTGAGSRLPTLDMGKLRKVQALMHGGKTEGERQVARSKAETLAAKAGRALQEALSRLDTPSQPQPGNIFAGFDDWMEAKEPGWKVEQAARRADREATRLARCRELLAEHGSEEAVFAPTDIEVTLRDALAPMADPENTLWGYRDFKAGTPTAAMWGAMAKAARLPRTVPEAWAAYQELEARQDARCAFSPDYTPHAWEEAWRSDLEHLLDNLSTPSVQGIMARLDWMDFLANRDFSRGIDRDKEVLAALRADFEAIAAGVQTGQPKASRSAERKAQVRDLLKREPSLPDREIARRVGCSPQTVGNWRRRLHQGGRSAA